MHHRVFALMLMLALAGFIETSRLAAAEEDKVRETFTTFQAALKGRDNVGIWKLLDADSQAAAERAARTIRAAYGKASAEKKARMEKAMAIPAADLAALTGEGFLKTKRFLGKYDEVPTSKIDKITVKDKQATVHYTEADGDKEKLQANLQNGTWKLAVPMPPVGE